MANKQDLPDARSCDEIAKALDAEQVKQPHVVPTRVGFQNEFVQQFDGIDGFLIKYNRNFVKSVTIILTEFDTLKNRGPI